MKEHYRNLQAGKLALSLSLALFTLIVTPTEAKTRNSDPRKSEISLTNEGDEAKCLFKSAGRSRPYRIPAIAQAKNGDLITVSDDRYCGADIGYGRVDLVYKVSRDNGRTWSNEDLMLAQGDGDDASNTCGYGDAAICADRESNRILLMCVTARTGATCWTKDQRGAVAWGTYNKSQKAWEWSKPIDIKDELMALLPEGRINYFVGSGKISQSRIVKKDKYYRVYVALWTYGEGGICNYVIYSDDFGAPGSWRLLGSKDDKPAQGSDEPKAEELPNGNVILSGRKSGGRFFNIFSFDSNDRTTGSWHTCLASNMVQSGLNWGSNSTNGEIMVVKARRKSDGSIVDLALQSAPAGNGRDHVSVWYKPLRFESDYCTPAAFSKGWTLGKLFTPHLSAYSTMCIQKDGRIAFFYEDGEAGAYYDMKYSAVTLEEITGGEYRFSFEK